MVWIWCKYGADGANMGQIWCKYMVWMVEQERDFQHNDNLHIDEASSGVEVFTDIEGLVHILGEHSRGETVLGVVRPLDHPLHVAGVELGVAHVRFVVMVMMKVKMVMLMMMITLEMHMMGPKLSSLARNMSSSTSQKMVGSMNRPGRSNLLPPRTSFAP